MEEGAGGAWPYPVGHLVADPQEHQHVVTLRHPHCVQVAEDVGTGDPALEEQVGEKGWPVPYESPLVSSPQSQFLL